MKRTMLNRGQIGNVAMNIILETCKYLRKHPNIESLILGMSGGVDSALVGMLAHDICTTMDTSDWGNRKIKLIIRSLPINSNKPEEIGRALRMGNSLSFNFKEVRLDAEFNALREGFAHEEKSMHVNDHDYKVRMGNIKARIRMVYLYNLASLHKGMVLSTDNFTELLLGFWTLHGDVGDYGMIQNLWKTEVYEMTDYFIDTTRETPNETKLRDALIACREAVPTDGLGITDSDMDQFDGKTYEEVDEIFIDILNNGYSKVIQQGEIPHVLKMYERNMFKRENPFNIPREVLVNMGMP